MADNRDAAKDAARAHTNLNAFAAVVALMENGLVYGYQPEAERIIKIAKKAQSRFLDEYDEALDKITEDQPHD